MLGKIFLINDDKIEAVNEYVPNSELDFEDLLEKYPELIPGEQIDSENPLRWMPVGRQHEIDGIGPYDLFFVDHEGIPTLIELKKGKNPELRREVVGQIFDYCANLSTSITIGKFREYINDNNYNEKFKKFIGNAIDPDRFWCKVAANLEKGRIRLIFVADEIPKKLQKIIELINNDTIYMEILAVELKQYHLENSNIKTIVPRLIGHKSNYQSNTQSELREEFLCTITEPEKEFYRELFEFAKENNLTEKWKPTTVTINLQGGGKEVCIIKGHYPTHSMPENITTSIHSIKNLDNGEEIAQRYVEKTLELSKFKTYGNGFSFRITSSWDDDVWKKFKLILTDLIDEIKETSK